MEIIIASPSDDDKISHSLVLIEGNVSGIQNTRLTSISVGLSGKLLISWPVIDGRFKALVDLKSGFNHIDLLCDNIVQTLGVTYEPPTFDSTIQLLYVVASDDLYESCFQGPIPSFAADSKTNPYSIDSACRRICLGAKLIQAFTAESLHRHGLGRRTFRLSSDPTTGEPTCRRLRLRNHTTRQAATLSEGALWRAVKDELARRPDAISATCKFVGFVSFTRYRNEQGKPPEDHGVALAMTEGHVALGGGGLALLGTGCLHTWAECLADVVPRFTDVSKVDSLFFLDDSCYRGTYGGCYSTTLGAMCHELGHTFDLGHTAAGIMGRGFDNIRNVFVLPKLLLDEVRSGPRPVLSSCSQHEFSSSVETCSLLGMQIPNFVAETADLGFLSETKLSQRFLDWNGAYWCRDSAVWLAHHRWLNNANLKNSGQGPKLYGCELRARHGLRVVIASTVDSGTSRHWEFLKSNGRLTFRLNPEDFGGGNAGKPVSVLLKAIDSFGNTLSSHIFI